MNREHMKELRPCFGSRQYNPVSGICLACQFIKKCEKIAPQCLKSRIRTPTKQTTDSKEPLKYNPFKKKGLITMVSGSMLVKSNNIKTTNYINTNIL